MGRKKESERSDDERCKIAPTNSDGKANKKNSEWRTYTHNQNSKKRVENKDEENGEQEKVVRKSEMERAEESAK